MKNPFQMMTNEQYEQFKKSTPGPANVHCFMRIKKEIKFLISWIIISVSILIIIYVNGIF